MFVADPTSPDESGRHAGSGGHSVGLRSPQYWMFAHLRGKTCCRGSVLRASQRDAGLADAAGAKPGAAPGRCCATACAPGMALVAAWPAASAWPPPSLRSASGPWPWSARALLAVALWQRSLRGSFLVGLIFGLAFFVPLLSWVINVAWYAWAGWRSPRRAVRRARPRPAAAAPAAPWPLAVGVLVGGGRVAARPVAVRRLPVGPAGHEPGGRADRPWVAVGGPYLLTFLRRAGRRLPGLADPGPGPAPARPARRRPLRRRALPLAGLSGAAGWPWPARCCRWTAGRPVRPPPRSPPCRATCRTPGTCPTCCAATP